MKPIVQITLLSVMLMLASLGRLFGQSQDLAKATIVSISTLTASSDLQFDTKSNHKDPYTSDEQRVRDTYQLNDKDWYSVTFEQVEAQSKCQLALHQDWIKEKGYQLNDTVHMNLLEQGISGPFHITDIKHILPQKVPDEDIADGYAYRPVTGLFTHVSDKVLMVHFESGDSLGITENHPVYSASAGGWKHAFELEKDEVVLSYFGQSKVSKITKLQGTHHVYNLEVKDLHNFLVGNEGLVVHNTCWGGWLKKLCGKTLTDIQDITGKKWAKKIKGSSIKDKEIQQMETLGEVLKEEITGLTTAFPGIDAVTKSGKIVTLKKCETNTWSALNANARALGDKVNEFDQGYFDVHGVLTSTVHNRADIIDSINLVKKEDANRFKLFKKILIQGTDGIEWYNF
ncbi:MAG: hypothetical protein IPO37_18470 [Saprospiraceae bacterium]|nr:hypothetical protein [Saprospiraceae bacterium]